ncbi:hypothetical protein HNV08_13720 [Winogradskyella eckloniae]|uniref:hypothetical protein n=1 Tax=Winogradskyella eckloniae TaxID=1089306 RepID=UPI0015641B87|nr:hypothetical protein [Winogradskyella eckloniae]NRD21111.1 hypothetical protein [Winogradskyella eckloniae]
MKKLLVLIAIMSLPLIVISQQSHKQQPLQVIEFNDNVKLPLTDTERSQIEEVYGEYAEKYVYNNPFRLLSIKNILRNRVTVEIITNNGKQKECTKLSEVPVFNNYNEELEHDAVFNPENFNPLKYSFKFYSRSAAIYHVDNTNYYIVVKSQYQ